MADDGRLFVLGALGGLLGIAAIARSGSRGVVRGTRRDHEISQEPTATCANCGRDFPVSDLLEINDYDERVDEETEALPDGECPECGALCYRDEQPWDKAHGG